MDAVVAGGTVATLTRVLQCAGSQRVKNEASNVLNMISDAWRSLGEAGTATKHKHQRDGSMQFGVLLSATN